MKTEEILERQAAEASRQPSQHPSQMNTTMELAPGQLLLSARGDLSTLLRQCRSYLDGEISGWTFRDAVVTLAEKYGVDL